MLACAHAGFHHVDYIVAQLFALADDVHIHRTDGIGVAMFVYVADVLGLQLIAIVVDFVLDIERRVGIDGLAALDEHDVHVRQRVVGESEHLMDVLILLGGEVFLARMAAVDGARQIVTTVADTLYLADFAQHGSDLSLRLVAQVGVAHLV